MTDFVGRLTAPAQALSRSLTQRHWVHGKKADGSFGVLWLTPQGDRDDGAGLEFSGRADSSSYVLGPVGEAPTLYIALNAAPEPIEFSLPHLPGHSAWKLLLNTADDEPPVTFVQIRVPP